MNNQLQPPNERKSNIQVQKPILSIIITLFLVFAIGFVINNFIKTNQIYTSKSNEISDLQDQLGLIYKEIDIISSENENLVGQYFDSNNKLNRKSKEILLFQHSLFCDYNLYDIEFNFANNDHIKQNLRKYIHKSRNVIPDSYYYYFWSEYTSETARHYFSYDNISYQFIAFFNEAENNKKEGIFSIGDACWLVLPE